MQLSSFLSGVNVNDAKSGEQRPLVDAGTYPTRITKAEIKNTNSGWIFFNVELTIQGGKFDGRRLYHSFTLYGVPTEKCDQAKADEMAAEGQQKLLGFLVAAGHPNPNNPDSARIEGLAVSVKTFHGKGRDGNKENKISSWEKVSATTGVSGGAAQGRTQAPQGMFGAAARAQAPLNITNSGEKSVAITQNSGVQASTTGADLDDEIPF